MKANRWKTCTVFEVAPDARRLWQFGAAKDRVNRGLAQTFPIDKQPPAGLVRKDWRSLVSPRLNIALLPPHQVFLRAIELPPCDPSELAGMVEFQLEHVSPAPVNQVVWTAEAIPHPDGKMQTAIVAIAERGAVEQFLGKLESDGFVADRLEIPMLRELRAEPQGPDGLWLFVHSEVDRRVCLAAWWSGGILRELSLSLLPSGPEAAETFIRQLTHTAWAGELAGWLSGTPAVSLVADPDAIALLEGPLTAWSAKPVSSKARLRPDEVAELTARQALEPQRQNLIPAERLARNRQQFIDGIWMRGLATVGIVYLLGVLVYLVVLYLKSHALDDQRAMAVQLGRQYTNTIQLKEQVLILEDQVNLKFAALDCWRAAVEQLPAALTLTTMNFDKGKTMTLNGTVSADASGEVAAYERALRGVNVEGQPLFSLVKTESIDNRGAGAQWRISAQLKRTERP